MLAVLTSSCCTQNTFGLHRITSVPPATEADEVFILLAQRLVKTSQAQTQATASVQYPYDGHQGRLL